jgi:hypothetical protein
MKNENPPSENFNFVILRRFFLRHYHMNKRQWYGAHLYTESERTYYAGFTYDNQIFRIGFFFSNLGKHISSTQEKNAFSIML